MSCKPDIGTSFRWTDFRDGDLGLESGRASPDSKPSGKCRKKNDLPVPRPDACKHLPDGLTRCLLSRKVLECVLCRRLYPAQWGCPPDRSGLTTDQSFRYDRGPYRRTNDRHWRPAPSLAGRVGSDRRRTAICPRCSPGWLTGSTWWCSSMAYPWSCTRRRATRCACTS